MADGDDTITLTRDDLQTILRQAKPTAADVAEGYRLFQASAKEQEASRSAQERLVMGVFGSWFRRHWKAVTGTVAALSALAGGSWKGWEWVQQKAEVQVLERQASEKQADSVDKNTAAVGALTTKQGELTRTVTSLQTDVEFNSKINRILLELQLRDSKTKRAIKNDKDLKAQVEAITGKILD